MVNPLPVWAKDLLGTVSGFGSWLMLLLSPFLALVVAILPFAPFLLIFYVADVLMSAVVTGDIKSVGVAFQGLYDTAVGIAGTIVSVVQAAIQFLHFW